MYTKYTPVLTVEKYNTWDRVRIVRRHFSTMRHFSTSVNLAQRVTLARRVTFVQRHFSTEGNFTTASIQYNASFQHRGLFQARCVTLAWRVILPRRHLSTVRHFGTVRHFCTVSLLHGVISAQSLTFARRQLYQSSFLQRFFFLHFCQKHIFSQFVFWTQHYFGQININFKPSYENFLIVHLKLQIYRIQ